MAKPRNTSFYHTRFNRVKISQAKAAEILGCSIDEVQKYDDNGAPLMAERLLLLWDQKAVGVDGWQGWRFSRGTLRYGRLQWRPDNIINDRRFREALELDSDRLIRAFKNPC